MRNLFASGSRWMAMLAAAGALSLAVAPATADPHRKAPSRHGYSRSYKHERHREWKGRADHRHWKSGPYRPRVVRYRNYGHHHRPWRYVHWYEPYSCYLPYPVWVESPGDVYVYHDRPFYFHAGFGIYFGSGSLSIEIGDYAPAGYVYFDPYCDLTFMSVADYRGHIRRHRHDPLLEVEFAAHGSYEYSEDDD